MNLFCTTKQNLHRGQQPKPGDCVYMDRSLFLVRADGSLLPLEDFFKNPDAVILRGLDGAPGDRGPAGPQGIPGIPGVGEKGDRGPQGPPAAQGVQGTTGLQGRTGERGEKGDRGERGATGATGAQGISGPRGDVLYVGTDQMKIAVNIARAELIKEQARARAAVIVEIENAERIHHVAKGLVLAHLRNLQRTIG